MPVTFPHAIFEFCSYLSFSHCFTETVLVLLRAGTVSLFWRNSAEKSGDASYASALCGFILTESKKHGIMTIS
jgi:hypothetical protein